MAIKSALVILALFLISTAFAQADLPPWNWSAYSGTVQWSVTVTEDQSGCQGPVLTDVYDVPISFSHSSATMGDVGHGPATGNFISGNILHMGSRKVSDSPGSSTLSAYDVYFTTDCSAFAAKYTWDYSGPDGGCSGSTKLAGSNSGGCPLLPGTCRSGLDCNATSSCVNGVCVPTQTQGVCNSDSDCNSGKVCVNNVCVSGGSSPEPPAPIDIQLESARKDLNNDLLTRKYKDQLMEELERSYGWYSPGSYEAGYAKNIQETIPKQMASVQGDIDKAEATLETKYKAILATDPSNVQANWDMAELRKSQGNNADYQTYIDRALGKITENQAQEVKTNVQSSLGLQTTPTAGNSKVVQQVGTELKEIKSMGGVEISQLTQKQQSSLMKNLVMMALFDKNGDVLSKLDIKFK